MAIEYTHGVLVPQQIAAMNIDSLNRHAIESSGSDIDDGNIFELDYKHTSGSLTEVWEVAPPASGSLTDLWMAYDVSFAMCNGQRFSGLSPDPRTMTNYGGYVFSSYKPQVADIILLTDEGIDGTKGDNEYIVAVDGSYKFEWAAAPIDGLSYRLWSTQYISLATGSIGDKQRVDAYQFECVSI